MRECSSREADTSSLAKEKKRKRKSTTKSSKSKKAKVQKPEVDSVIQTSGAAEGPELGVERKMTPR